MIESSARIGLALSALSLPLGVGPGTARSNAATVPDRPSVVVRECEATIDPSQVATHEYPVHVFAEISRPIGDEVEATAPEESGLVVHSTERTESPTSFELVLDTSDAEPGEWTLTLSGDGGECQGAITVVERRSAPPHGDRDVPAR